MWSYHFTAYSNFQSVGNAVTPRPNWQFSGTSTRVSTTPPLSETQYDAMDFSLFKKIGSEVLVKSNINNWIACRPGSGSLVDWRAGSVTCRLVRALSSKCTTVVPRNLKFYSPGPGFDGSTHYYLFDASTSGWYPTHDPCGRNQPNQLKGVRSPRGNVFIR